MVKRAKHMKRGWVGVRDRFCTGGWWARNGLPGAADTAPVPEFRERLGRSETLGLDFGWSSVELGAGLSDPCGSAPTQNVLLFYEFATMPSSLSPNAVLEVGLFKTEFPPLAEELVKLKCYFELSWLWERGCLSNNNLFSAELSGGVPTLTVSHSSGELFLQLSKKVNVADRRWHNIKIKSDGKASVNVDDPEEVLIYVSSYPLRTLSFFCRGLSSILPSLQCQRLMFVRSAITLVRRQSIRRRS